MQGGHSGLGTARAAAPARPFQGSPFTHMGELEGVLLGGHPPFCPEHLGPRCLGSAGIPLHPPQPGWTLLGWKSWVLLSLQEVTSHGEQCVVEGSSHTVIQFPARLPGCSILPGTAGSSTNLPTLPRAEKSPWNQSQSVWVSQ